MSIERMSFAINRSVDGGGTKRHKKSALHPMMPGFVTETPPCCRWHGGVPFLFFVLAKLPVVYLLRKLPLARLPRAAGERLYARSSPSYSSRETPGRSRARRLSSTTSGKA